MKNFFKMICDGFDSICRGFDEIVRATAYESLDDTFERLDIPKTDEEAFERDRNALESDWKNNR